MVCFTVYCRGRLKRASSGIIVEAAHNLELSVKACIRAIRRLGQATVRSYCCIYGIVSKATTADPLMRRYHGATSKQPVKIGDHPKTIGTDRRAQVK